MILGLNDYFPYYKDIIKLDTISTIRPTLRDLVLYSQRKRKKKPSKANKRRK